MAVKTIMPSSNKRRSVISEFVSANFTDTSGIIADNQSPDTQNMIRDVPGKVRKCMGYEKIRKYSGRINGYHVRRGDGIGIVHAGTKMYKEDSVLYDGMADARSRSFQMGSKLYIIDGKALLVYDGTTVKKATEIAYIPTITIAKSSEKSAGYEAVNLLQPKFREQFYNTSATTFTMSLSPLDDGSTVVVEWKNSNGEWEDISNKITNINYATSTITLNSAQTASITGEDNIRITAQKTVPGYADRINHCTVGILFGVNGGSDRLFLSGNESNEFINYDWYSGQNDPTYFPDNGYATLGTQVSAVMGYCILDNYLVATKDNMEVDRNVIVRRGDLVESEPAFPIVNTMQGPGEIAKFSLAYLETEPLFLTNSGVYAITTSDLSGKEYTQRRSYFLDGKLEKESNRENAFAFVFHDMYWLCLNGVAYILDGLQPIKTDRSAPYATRQYAGFYRTNLPARVMWEQSGRLFFGSDDGTVYRFYNDTTESISYNDDGKAIDAYWTLPLNFGGAFFLNKNFKKMSVLLDANPTTGVELWAKESGKWELQGEEEESTRYFTWDSISWGSFSWSTDTSPVTITEKINIKKVDEVQFKYRNARIGEPFGILQAAVEYTVGNYYKGR